MVLVELRPLLYPAALYVKGDNFCVVERVFAPEHVNEHVFAAAGVASKRDSLEDDSDESVTPLERAKKHWEQERLQADQCGSMCETDEESEDASRPATPDQIDDNGELLGYEGMGLEVPIEHKIFDVLELVSENRQNFALLVQFICRFIKGLKRFHHRHVKKQTALRHR